MTSKHPFVRLALPLAGAFALGVLAGLALPAWAGLAVAATFLLVTRADETGWWRHRTLPPDAPPMSWALWRWVEIRSQEGPGIYDHTGPVYLRRLLVLRTPLGNVMLHWLLRPDPDRHVHDHPWAFLSIPLRGCYMELVRGRRPLDLPTWALRSWRRWSLKRATDAHRIVHVSGFDDGSPLRLQPGPPITLVLTGPRVRTWGFYTPDGWIDWRTYCFGPSPAVAPASEVHL